MPGYGMNTRFSIRSAAMVTALISSCFFAATLARADSLSSYDSNDRTFQEQWDSRSQHSYSSANSYSLGYLKEARKFRSAGRYELARQRYLQALSICTDDRTIHILKQELDGVELLLRTMR